MCRVRNVWDNRGMACMRGDVSCIDVSTRLISFSAGWDTYFDVGRRVNAGLFCELYQKTTSPLALIFRRKSIEFKKESLCPLLLLFTRGKTMMFSVFTQISSCFLNTIIILIYLHIRKLLQILNRYHIKHNAYTANTQIILADLYQMIQLTRNTNKCIIKKYDLKK